MLGLFIELVHDYIYLNTFGCRVAPVPPPPAPATGRLESYRMEWSRGSDAEACLLVD